LSQQILVVAATRAPAGTVPGRLAALVVETPA
jgi:hypothetical protein